MSTVACPHCGRQNFAITAYCARCERPLAPPAHVDDPPGEATASAVADATPVRSRTPTTKPRLSPQRRAAAGDVAARADQGSFAPSARTTLPLGAPEVPAGSVPPERQPPEVLPVAAPPPPNPAHARPEPLPLIVRKLAPTATPLTRDRMRAERRGRSRGTPKHRRTKPANANANANAPAAAVKADARSHHSADGDPRVALIAPLWRRACGCVIDVPAMALPALGANWGIDRLVAWALEPEAASQAPRGAWGLLVAGLTFLHATPRLTAILVAMGVGATYVFVSSLRGGCSLGGWVLGTRLVTEQGFRCNVWTAGTRALAWIGSVAAGGAGVLWCIVDRRHRAWHDLLAGTVMVVVPMANRKPTLGATTPPFETKMASYSCQSG